MFYKLLIVSGFLIYIDQENQRLMFSQLNEIFFPYNPLVNFKCGNDFSYVKTFKINLNLI